MLFVRTKCQTQILPSKVSSDITVLYIIPQLCSGSVLQQLLFLITKRAKVSHCICLKKIPKTHKDSRKNIFIGYVYPGVQL